MLLTRALGTKKTQPPSGSIIFSEDRTFSVWTLKTWTARNWNSGGSSGSSSSKGKDIWEEEVTDTAFIICWLRSSSRLNQLHYGTFCIFPFIKNTCKGRKIDIIISSGFACSFPKTFHSETWNWVTSLHTKVYSFKKCVRTGC